MPGDDDEHTSPLTPFIRGDDSTFVASLLTDRPIGLGLG